MCIPGSKGLATHNPHIIGDIPYIYISPLFHMLVATVLTSQHCRPFNMGLASRITTPLRTI